MVDLSPVKLTFISAWLPSYAGLNAMSPTCTENLSCPLPIFGWSIELCAFGSLKIELHFLEHPPELISRCLMLPLPDSRRGDHCLTVNVYLTLLDFFMNPHRDKLRRRWFCHAGPYHFVANLFDAAIDSSWPDFPLTALPLFPEIPNC